MCAVLDLLKDNSQKPPCGRHELTYSHSSVLLMDHFFMQTVSRIDTILILDKMNSSPIFVPLFSLCSCCYQLFAITNSTLNSFAPPALFSSLGYFGEGVPQSSAPGSVCGQVTARAPHCLGLL